MHGPNDFGAIDFGLGQLAEPFGVESSGLERATLDLTILDSDVHASARSIGSLNELHLGGFQIQGSDVDAFRRGLTTNMTLSEVWFMNC